MNPEVIANLWSFVRGSYIQELGVRLYMVPGSDDEKTEFLKSLAPFDYRFSRRFPVSGGLKGIKAEGLETALSGVNYLDYFREVWDTVKKSVPVHPIGLSGKKKISAPLETSNLLSVYTAIDVDSDGNHRPCLPDPQRAKSKPRLILNRWAFADHGTSNVFATAGRAYLASGSDAQLSALLTTLASDDYLLASRSLLPQVIASSELSSAFARPSMFDPVLQDIQQSTSTSKLDVATKPGAIFHFRPADAIVKGSLVMENENSKTSQTSVAAPMPEVTKLSPSSGVAPATSGSKWSLFGWLFGSKTEPSTGGQKTPAHDPRASWTEPAQYANALIALVGQPVQWETTGLEKKKVHVRQLGEEINQKFGFKGMQLVWELVRRAKGPSATSDLNRIWDGVGQWRK